MTKHALRFVVIVYSFSTEGSEACLQPPHTIFPLKIDILILFHIPSKQWRWDNWSKCARDPCSWRKVTAR